MPIDEEDLGYNIGWGSLLIEIKSAVACLIVRAILQELWQDQASHLS